MPNFSGIWTVTQQMQAKGASTWPATPGAPTIGTATAGTAACASVTFTAPACTGYPAGGITGYRVISTPGCFSNTGASSPVVVSGLTVGTSYTFKAQATNAIGYGALSAASNSITAAIATCTAYTSGGTYSWVAPTGVTSVAVVVVGSGGFNGSGSRGAGGGALAYKNAITVTPGSSYNVVVGASGGATTYSTFTAGATTVRANGGGNGSDATAGAGGTRACSYDGGGNGGNGGNAGCCYGAGGGAGGYAGTGGNGGVSTGSGGSASGGRSSCGVITGGGGVGLFGQGASGASFGAGGSGGSSATGRSGASYGGGSAHSGSAGGSGAVRVVYCIAGIRGTPSFPSTNVGA